MKFIIEIFYVRVASICSNFIMGSHKNNAPSVFSCMLKLCQQLLLRCWYFYVLLLFYYHTVSFLYRFLLINFNTFVLAIFIAILNGAKPTCMKHNIYTYYSAMFYLSKFVFFLNSRFLSVFILKSYSMNETW